ncbi:unnamed protein product, partial [marine sediment metagenome]
MANKMAEKALTTYDDSIMSAIPQVLMVMMGLVLLVAILPVTQYAQAQAQAQAYMGRTVTKTVKANGNLKYLDVRYDYPYTLWISAYFINDGPDPVEIAINYPDDRFTIKPNGTVTVNRSGAQERIAVIFYVCERGKTA